MYARRVKRLWSSVILVAFGCGALVQSYLMGDTFLGGMVASAALMLIGQGCFKQSLTKAAFRRLWESNPTYGKAGTCRVDDGGYCVEGYDSAANLSWQKFTHWAETKRLLLLYTGRDSCLYVPKRCLCDEGQETEFRNLLKKHIGRTKYERGVPAFPVEVRG